MFTLLTKEKLTLARALASLFPLFLSFSFAFPATGHAKDPLITPGLTREFTSTIEAVRQAVQEVQHDQIIHGTLVFDKEPVLTGAETANSTPLFDPWTGPGEVYFKIRKNTIAPRHFLDSADQGTVAVRYVIIPVTTDRTRVHVDAVYLESFHPVTHASDGTVEKMEMKEIKDRIDQAEAAALDAADAKRRKASAELVHQSFVRQQESETSRIGSAKSAEQDLQEQVVAMRHELERRIKAPGADVKAAPFQSAATLKTLAAYSDVVILIVTPHWMGIETTEGQRGWIFDKNLEPLP